MNMHDSPTKGKPRPSRALYATATAAAREAAPLAHTGLPSASGICAGRCDRCRLEAKARLFVRVGDSAAAIADGGPSQ